MRQQRALALAISIGSVALVAGVWDSCEGEEEPAPPRVMRRARTPRAPRLRAWSSTAWIAPADAGAPTLASTAVFDEEDASVEPDVTSPLVEQLCRPLAVSLCESRAQCECGNTLGCVYAEMQRCEEWLDCAYPSPDPEWVVDHGRLASCIARVTNQHALCIAPPPLEECYSLLVDPAMDGEPCVDADMYECVGGYCVEGVCRRMPDLGERCDEACAPGAFCSGSGLCRSMLGIECSFAADCGTGAGLACVEGRCGIPRTEGQACDSDEACAPRLACAEGRCVHTERCERHVDCHEGDECSGAFELRCVPAATWPLGQRGERCAWGTCADGLACRDGACADAPSGGQPCPEGTCAPGSVCEMGVCAPRDLELGAACVSYADRCAPGLACHYGDDGPRCRRARSLHERCERDPCERGLTCDAVFEDGRCTAELCDADRADPWSCDVD